jgi:2-polyprenyl-3-methyl-5-hydroxy-6-metoxy-1,4-benzoquinol methylase
MRASTEEIRERQRPYVELLRTEGPVLDVGCGRGELLTLLRDAGVEARGIDADADMVAFARGEGLNVEQVDLLDALASVPEESLGAVTALQVVEHLPPAALVRFLELALRALRPGGLLVAETIHQAPPAALRPSFATSRTPSRSCPRHSSCSPGTEASRARARVPEPAREPRTPDLRQLFAPLDYALIAAK